MSRLTNNFNALKNKYPKMTDTEAMAKAMKLTSEGRKKVRKADKKEGKKLNWAQKLKMGITKQMSDKAHSPAGRKYRRKKKAGVGKGY